MIQYCLHRSAFLAAASGALLALSLPASADMSLDASQSTVSLLSTKILADGTASVTERHQFTDVSGSVDADGTATVTIPLGSIETNIPIRNERMAEFLFETDTYPEATIEAMVPAELLDAGNHLAELSGNLTLHGQTQEITLPVSISVTDQTVVVTATEPVILDASAYALDGGIGKLTELAGLLHIPTTVPVSFNLTFSESDG